MPLLKQVMLLVRSPLTRVPLPPPPTRDASPTSASSRIGLWRMQHCSCTLRRSQMPTPPALETIYETDMAEGLKAMALEGHGLAFLPASSVRKELKARRLVHAAPPGVGTLTMEVRIYRARPEAAKHSKPAAQALWDFLKAAG